MSAIGDDPACQMADESLLNLFNVSRSCVGTAAKSCVDAVNDFLVDNLVGNDLATGFDISQGR